MYNRGDHPVQPLTDQSVEEEYQYPMVTMNSNQFSMRKYNMAETAQSHQSLQKFNTNLLSRQSLAIYQQLNLKNQEQSKKPQSQIHKKLNNEYKELKKKRELLIEENQKQILNQCSFAPQISNKSRQIGQDNVVSPRYLSPKATINKIVEQISDGKPQISETSKKMIDNKENVFKRLYFHKQEYKQIQSAKISRRSSPETVDAITQRLYENAFQPKRYKSPNQTQQQTNKIENNELQTKYLIHHFVKEFYKAITNARVWTLENWTEEKKKIKFQYDVQTDLCLLTINELAITLDRLGFLPFKTYDLADENSSIYKLYQFLKCPQEFELILSRNLLTFLLSMQGIQIDKQIVPFYTNTYNIKFPRIVNHQILHFDNGNLVIKQTEFLQKQFQSLYLNYLSYKKVDVPQQEKKQFLKVNEQTEQLAKQYRTRMASQYQLDKESVDLNEFNKIYQIRKTQMQQQINSESQLNCTFKPQINKTESINSKFMQPLKKGPVVPPLREEQPTFTPDISRSQSTLGLRQSPVNSTGIVQRMVKGRIEKQLNNLLLEQGTSNSKKRKILEQKLFEDEINKNKQPLLHIDVTLCNNTTKRITVFPNDSPGHLAEKFIRENNLPKTMREQIVKLINDQLH
ncbi:hypothetical protein pb186bvf_010372 [Paramecium bursaria]